MLSVLDKRLTTKTFSGTFWRVEDRMGTVSEDIRRLLDDCELFVSDILQDEHLSNHARETREILLRNFRVVHNRNPQVFPYRSESVQEESSDDNRSSSLGRSDNLSVASDYQEDGSPEYFEEIPIIAAQDLSNILRQGYLEKKRRDHSFFGSEWQKRWCVLNNTIFYYYGNEKDKQQKGSFYINGYSAELVANMRKDSKKNSCFELTAPGRRTFQFTASNPREAREWVDQINFVLKDLSSNFIPFDDDEVDEEEEEEETYDDIEGVTGSQPRPPPTPAMVQAQPRPPPINNKEDWKAKHMGQEGEEQDDDDIYEVLPQDEFPESVEDEKKSEFSSEYANYYQCLWDCEAEQPDELSFERGDVIYIISKEYNIHGWWVGEKNGTVGIVPKDFLLPAYIL